MPVLEHVRPAACRPIRSGGCHRDPARRVRVAGGTVTTIVSGKDTLWSRPPVTLSGVVIDSVSRNAVPKSRVTLAARNHEAVTDDRGRFTIADVLPGAYSTEVRTPALSSINAVHTLEIGVADSAANVEIRVPTPSRSKRRCVARSDWTNQASSLVRSSWRSATHCRVTRGSMRLRRSTHHRGHPHHQWNCASADRSSRASPLMAPSVCVAFPSTRS